MKDVYSAAKKLKMERVKQVQFWALLSQADSIMLFCVSETKKMKVLLKKCSADKLLLMFISTGLIGVTAVCVASSCVTFVLEGSLKSRFCICAPVSAKRLLNHQVCGSGGVFSRIGERN